FQLHLDWSALLAGALTPRLQFDRDTLLTVVAVLGTTISPYLFFWQAAEEAEDLHAFPRRRALLHAPEQGGAALRRIEVDTLVGMAFSNLVALAIM
ncbi:divalent metal cation transporter, partial [Salmonella enterica]|uniref:divalent metal cation transporter n=1 Tax=Salmonella enterica TaxID=28901 RepID=UPI003FD8B546